MGSPSPNRLGLRALQVLVVEDAADAREALVELVRTFGAEAWGAEPRIYSQEDTERALGTSCANERLVQMWWD